jgi:hypothetical protein
MLKSIAVVVGTYVLSIALVLCSDPLLSALFPGDFVHGRIPSDTALAASTALFVAISVLCAWLCARFSPAPASRHVVAFLVLGELLGIASTIPNWNTGWPHWYWLSWLVSWPFSCLAGYRLAPRNVTAA